MRPTRVGIHLATALIGALWLLPCAPASAEVLSARSVQSETLGNGLRVVVCEDNAAPVVALEVVVRVGSADETPEESGIAHFLEHLCWVGDQGNDPRATIEDAGGSTNAGTLRDFTRYYATVPPADLGRALRGLAAMALREAFDETVVSRERAVIQEEAATRMERPRAALNDLAFETLYGSADPYGRHIEGNEMSLAQISSAQLALFHRTWYVPNNMAVIVGGCVTFDAAVREVESAFGALKPAALPERAGDRKTSPGGAERAAEAPANDAYVMAAFASPAVSEPAAVCASDVIATILGDSRVGRLVTKLRDDQGLVKVIGVDFLTQRRQGLFGIWAVCEADKISAVKRAITAELHRLASESVSAEELATAERLLAAGYAFANETVAERVSTLGFYEAIDSYRLATEYLPLVRAVTSADVMKTAQRYAAEPVWVIMRPGAGQ